VHEGQEATTRPSEMQARMAIAHVLPPELPKALRRLRLLITI
jgi:hypothetical protein